MKKAFAAAVACVWSLFIVASSPGHAQSLEGTLKKIKSSKTLAVGYRADAWPFSFAPETGKPEGYSIELCQRIAAGVQQQLGLDELDVKYVEVTTQNRIQAVADRKIDIECGATTITLSRMEAVDFSNEIFVDGASVMARKRTGIKRLSDLSGKKVAVIPGTTTEAALREAVQKLFPKIELVPVNDYAEGLAAVESSAADGLAANRVLARLYRSGEVAAIYKKWFGPLGDPPGVLVLIYVLNALPA